MALETGLSMSQNLQMKQEMVMTPQMIQSMEMLQLPILALEQRVQQELLKNPALELAELEDEDAEEAARREDGGADDDDHASVEERTESSLVAADQSDYSWDEAYGEAAPRRRYDGEEDAKLEALYNTPDREETFQEHLAAQLSDLDLDARQRGLVERIIYSLDDAGYLRVALTDLNDPEEEQPASEAEWEAALRVVQGLEPAGVGARDVKECLLLQIDRLPGHHEFEHRMVEEHLEDLSANRLPAVAKAMDCDLEDVKAVLKFLHSLNPRPGLDYGPSEPVRVVPDVLVRQEDGQFVIRLNRGTLPELRVSPTCQQAARAEKGNTDTKRYLRECLMNAEWIRRAIEQRNSTLLHVTQAIVEHQKDFFLGATDQPGPLMMQTVADDVGIDISTVSRAVKGKYADTPRGLVSLRDMFTRSVGSGLMAGHETSNVQIMDRIREIVEAEDPKHPLKDAQIVDKLREQGIHIVRRTVAKYRQNLGIPSQARRRQY